MCVYADDEPSPVKLIIYVAMATSFLYPSAISYVHRLCLRSMNKHTHILYDATYQPGCFRTSLFYLQQAQQLAQRWVETVCTLQARGNKGADDFGPVEVCHMTFCNPA